MSKFSEWFLEQLAKPNSQKQQNEGKREKMNKSAKLFVEQYFRQWKEMKKMCTIFSLR